MPEEVEARSGRGGPAAVGGVEVGASAQLDDLVTDHARRHGISLSDVVLDAVNEDAHAHA